MAPITTTTSEDIHGPLAETLARVRTRTDQIGVNVSMWNAQGSPVAPVESCLSFCGQACGIGEGTCPASAASLVKEVLEQGWTISRSCELGCVVVGMPVWKRRRQIGVAVMSYPTMEMLEDGAFQQLCERLNVDRITAMTMARREFRHKADEMDRIKNTVEWLLQDAQSLQVAESELKTLSTNLSSTYEELSLLYGISGSVRVTQSPRQFLQAVCNEVLEVMYPEAVAAVLFPRDPQGQSEVLARTGILPMDDAALAAFARDHVVNRIESPPKTLVDNHVDTVGVVRNFIAVPLTAEGRLTGLLLVVNKCGGEFDSVDLKLVSAVGSQAEVFLENNRLYDDLQDLLMGVLHALTASIDAKDPYTCGHSLRVAQISQRLAEASGFEEEHIRRIYLAGLLHDIGKIGVPETILCKPGRLTAQEFDVIKTHPAVAERILTGIRQLDDVMAGIVSHHERLDGRGYPRGLRGDEIPMEGRIVALADAFDAMTSDRVYRKAPPLPLVLQEIRANAGTQFDSGLVDLFLAMDVEAFVNELRESNRPAPKTREDAA